MGYEDFAICQKCNGTMKRISPKDSSPFIVACKKCGHQEWAEIQVPPTWDGDNNGVPERRVVVYKKAGKVEAKVAMALRKVNEDLARLPVNEAIKKITSSTVIDLGVHEMEAAKDIQKRLEILGLKVRLVDPEEHVFEETEEKESFFEPFGASVTVGAPGEDSRIIPFWLIAFGAMLIIGVIAILVVLLS